MKDLLYNPIFQGVRRTFALLLCMLFVFVFVVSPIKVKAEAFPIPPLWLPMNPYNAQGLEGNYVLLNDDQKKIVKEVIGAANTVYLGMGGYALQMPITGIQATRQFYQEYGSTFLNTFWAQIMGTSRAMTDFVGSTIYKASTYDTYEEYEADTAPSVTSSEHKYFQISPELTVAFKNWYRANGGVEQWQMQPVSISSIGSFHWYHFTMNQTAQYQYEQYLGNIDLPHVQINYYRSNVHSTGFTTAMSGGEFFTNYCYLFINTQNGYIYLVNQNGSSAVNTSIPTVYYESYYGRVYSENGTVQPRNGYPINGYADIPTALNAVFSDGLLFYRGSSSDPYFTPVPNLQNFVKAIYYGATWADRQPYTMVEDLNIGNADSEYIQNIDNIGYVDINTLIGQIADEVINLREVVEESVLVKDGDTAIPYADSLQVAIDKYINQPESGVVIPVDIFGELTSANGPVSYLWFMTKPLVSYTGDLLGILTLDGDGTFQFTGLGYIVIGVVTVGIIGGLVTKCLL